MKQKDRSGPDPGWERLRFVAAKIDRTLASLRVAELPLRGMALGRLPRVAESLALAAGNVESLRGELLAAGVAGGISPALRAQCERLEAAALRVCALHRAARDFHLGLIALRRAETAEYDALGGVRGAPESADSQHGLEARG